MTRRDRNLLLIGTLGLFGVRLALSLLRSGPVLVADEIGYLMNARLLAGGLAGQLQLAPFYHGGYSLALAPLLALTSAPGLGYHLVLALNAVLAASLFPLLYVLLTRCSAVPPRVALGAAFAAALYPSVTILSQVAMSENLLFPLTCAWLIAACELIARPGRHGTAWAASSAALAGLAYATHGRMIVVVILTVAILLWLGSRRVLAPGAVVAALGVLVGGLLATHFLDAFIVSHNYGGHATSEAGSRLSALEHPSAAWGALENLAGQSWSLLVASFGLLAVVGLAAAKQLRSARTAGWTVADPAPPLTVVLAAGLLLVSAASFPVRSRSDMLIYGRYAEVIAPPLIALGLARLMRSVPTGAPRRHRGAWAVAFAALTGFVVIVQATGGLGHANRWDVASFPFVTSDLGPKVIVGAALVAAAGAWALRWTSRRRPGLAWMLAAALFVPITAYALHSPVLQAEHAVYPSGWTSPEAAADASGVHVVAYDLDRVDPSGGYPTVGDLYVVQWFLPRVRILLFRSDRRPPPAGWVISDPGWGARHAGLDAVLVWKSAGHAPEALWRLARR